MPLACRSGIINRLAARGSIETAAHISTLFAIGRDTAGGLLRLKQGRLDVVWDYPRDNVALIDRMLGAMHAVARAYGGRFSPLFTWTLFRRIMTVHSLGGCRLSDNAENGVVSPEGEVHGYPGLFVADGSVIPTAIGFHPCMTISAVAERTAEAIVRRAG